MEQKIKQALQRPPDIEIEETQVWCINRAYVITNLITSAQDIVPDVGDLTIQTTSHKINLKRYLNRLEITCDGLVNILCGFDWQRIWKDEEHGLKVKAIELSSGNVIDEKLSGFVIVSENCRVQPYKNSILFSRPENKRNTVLLKGGPFSYLTGAYSAGISYLLQEGYDVSIPSYTGDLYIETFSEKNKIDFLEFKKCLVDILATGINLDLVVAHSFGCVFSSYIEIFSIVRNIYAINGYIHLDDLRKSNPEIFNVLDNFPPHPPISKHIKYLLGTHDPVVDFEVILGGNVFDIIAPENIFPIDSNQHDLNREFLFLITKTVIV
ncbi:MAG: hypothetical protein IPL83_10770 [Bdellovibrionales bacterium]|nr:hypothetical protein [Bdellovibrionales bacterium]